MDGPHSDLACLQGGLARALFHEAGAALLLVDPLTEGVIEVNAMASRLSEFSREELLQGSIRSLIRHEQQWQDWLIAAQQKTRFHGKEGFLLRTRQPDRWVAVTLTISRIHDEAGSSFDLFTLNDRREQVEAQRRLQRSEAEVRRLLASASDCLWSRSIKLDGRVSYRYLSPAVERLTGRPAVLFLEDPLAWRQAVDEEDLSRWLDFEQRLRACTSGQLEYRLRRADGAQVWVRETVVAAPAAGGVLLHGVVSDISERKRAEQHRTEHLHGQLRKLDSLASLSGMLAHDFNNLITGILGHVSLARLTEPPSNPALARFAQIEEITLRAADLCKQLATVAGNGGTSSGGRDLNALVRDSADQIQRMLAPDARLQLRLSDTLPSVPGNEGQLRQVIVHLLGNACEALAGGSGEVVVYTWSCFPAGSDRWMEDRDSLCFEYFSEGLSASPVLACLEVTDSGPGLSISAGAACSILSSAPSRAVEAWGCLSSWELFEDTRAAFRCCLRLAEGRWCASFCPSSQPARSR